MWYSPSKIRFVSCIGIDVRNICHCGHVVNLANRETAVSSSVLLQLLWRNCASLVSRLLSKCYQVTLMWQWRGIGAGSSRTNFLTGMHCFKSAADRFSRCCMKSSITFTFYIYAFSRRFYPKRLTVQVTVSTLYQLLLSLGIEPMILALLVPCSTSWATGKPVCVSVCLYVCSSTPTI